MAYLDILYQKGSEAIIAEVYKPKTRIIAQGKRYSWLYVVRKGIAKCYLTDENGKSFIQEFLGEGMEFGEIEVFSGEPAFCDVATITELEVYKISHRHFNGLLETDKKFNRIILNGLALKIKYKAPRHSYQHSYSVEDNILRVQKMFPGFETVISKNDLANYLGITLRSLNRTMAGLRAKQ